MEISSNTDPMNNSDADNLTVPSPMAADDTGDISADAVTGEPFVMPVPDFVLVDRMKVLPYYRSAFDPIPMWHSLPRLIHLLVVAQRRATVTAPDYLFAQAVWGGNADLWPKNWRGVLVKKLKTIAAEDSSIITAFKTVGGKSGRRPCPQGCPMADSGRRHGHFKITIRTMGEDEPDWAEVERFELDPTDGAFLGLLELCGDGAGANTRYAFAKPPAPRRPKKKARLPAGYDLDDEGPKGDQLTGRVSYLQAYWNRETAATYYPLLLFAASPCMGLCSSEQMLMRALTYELTREARGTKLRLDRAQVMTGGKKAVAPGAATAYPGLTAGGRYVGFNGNGSGQRAKLHGKGYSLLQWMRRARYVQDQSDDTGVEPDPDTRQQSAKRANGLGVGNSAPATCTDGTPAADHGSVTADGMVNSAAGNHPDSAGKLPGKPVRRKKVSCMSDALVKVTKVFLKDLARMAVEFGLTAAAWHPRKREWLPLAALSGLLTSESGRKWLMAARLRIYTGEDYLTRWRALIAQRMGFSLIPALDDERVSESAVDQPAGSAASLRAFLAESKVAQNDFAVAAGVSKSTVSRRLSGDLPWSPTWVARVRSCLEARPEWGTEAAS